MHIHFLLFPVSLLSLCSLCLFSPATHSISSTFMLTMCGFFDLRADSTIIMYIVLFRFNVHSRLAYHTIDHPLYFVVGYVFSLRLESMADFDENLSLEYVKGLITVESYV